MNNKLLSYSLLGIGLLTLILVATIVFNPPAKFGGTTNFDQLDTTEGYSVDGTSIINGSGVFIGAVSGTTGAFSGRTTLNTLIQGGTVTTLTATTSTALTAAQVCDSSVIIWPNIIDAATANLTLPATTTLAADCLATNGDSKTLLYINQSSAATTTTIVAGSGIVLIIPETTGADVVIEGGNTAKITITRSSDLVIYAIVEEMIGG